MKILFLSNGHGEDVIAARIIKELSGESISILPIVGSGDVFDGLPVEILGPRKKMPSGGFIYQSLGNMTKDFFAGLASSTIEQIKILRSLKDKFDLTVSVGDIVPIVGALFSGNPFMFVGCAKSDYYNYSYTPWEKFLLKKYCSLCFARDEKTNANLKLHGIKSQYVGNPMMDCFEITGGNFGIEKGTAVIGILPGSRQDAALNLEDIGLVAFEMIRMAASNNKKVEFLVAVAPNTDVSAYQALPGMRIIKNKFGDILNNSDAVIGLSGTGNEQAAGLGKPVISFAGRGVQYTAAFAKRQKQLLGDALFISQGGPSVTAKEIWDILNDDTLKNRMAEAGRSRMGKPGASKKIADAIKNENWI